MQGRIAAEERYIQLLKEIVLQEVPDSYAVFLFGSRARKEQKKGADVDVGILGMKPVSLKIRQKILSLVEDSIIPLKVDVIDFYQVDTEFRQNAMRDIEIWRCPSTIKLV